MNIKMGAKPAAPCTCERLRHENERKEHESNHRHAKQTVRSKRDKRKGKTARSKQSSKPNNMTGARLVACTAELHKRAKKSDLMI